MRPTVEKRSPTLLVAAATLIGTSIEWYGFYIYGYAAALIFPTVFFPKSDPFVGQCRLWRSVECVPCSAKGARPSSRFRVEG